MPALSVEPETVDLFDLHIMAGELCTCALQIPGAIRPEDHEDGCRYRRTVEAIHPCLPDADAVREWRQAIYGGAVR
jgi:hypothetical protein